MIKTKALFSLLRTNGRQQKDLDKKVFTNIQSDFFCLKRSHRSEKKREDRRINIHIGVRMITTGTLFVLELHLKAKRQMFVNMIRHFFGQDQNIWRRNVPPFQSAAACAIALVGRNGKR